MPQNLIKSIKLIAVLAFSLSISCTVPDQALSNFGLNNAVENFTPEQFRNYTTERKRISRIVELVYRDIPEKERRNWQLLLLGTVAVESNFLDRYSGKSPNGNGPYQITGNTLYGIIHSYVTYPLRGSAATGQRGELISLFEKATNARITWDELIEMDRSQLIELCVKDYDFSALVSLLIYKEAFERNGIKTIPSDPEDLGKLWKQYYNSPQGAGTVERFLERFQNLYEPISDA